jgi:hypothetical protein
LKKFTTTLKKYSFILSDSRIQIALGKNIKIVSTTISLFKDILKCVGRKAINGKSKGGIKSHSVINADEKYRTWFGLVYNARPSVSRKLKCDAHTVYIFDKGYNDYKAFEHFTEQKQVLLLEWEQSTSNSKNLILETIHSGVLSDEIIQVEVDKGV